MASEALPPANCDAGRGVDRISVIMPCFNALAFVERAVESALEQSFPAVELIVVDDGSSDGSREVLTELTARYHGRMRVFHQEHQGPFPARNLGLSHATGTHVAFLDADDYWAKNCLERLACALQDANADVAYCGWQNVGDGGPGVEPYVPPPYESGDAVAQFLRSCPWPIHAALTRRSVIDEVHGFSTRMFSAMDYDLWLRVLGVTSRFVRVPEVLAFYRWHGGAQISSVKWRQVFDARQVRQDFVRAHPDRVTHLPSRVIRDLLDGSVLKAGYVAYWKRDLVSAQRLFRKAVGCGYWRLTDAPYVLSALLPMPIYRRLIALADSRPTSDP